MTTDKIIVQNIRRRRPATGRTQRACARLAHVAPQTWQAWESGARAIPTSHLDVIAMILGIDVLTLVTPLVPTPIPQLEAEAA